MYQFVADVATVIVVIQKKIFFNFTRNEVHEHRSKHTLMNSEMEALRKTEDHVQRLHSEKALLESTLDTHKRKHDELHEEHERMRGQQ